VVSDVIVEPTAQLVRREGSQIAASLHEKLCVGDIVFLGEPMQKRRRGIGPAAAVEINFQQQLRVNIDLRLQPLFSPSTSICFLMTATRDGDAIGGSLCASESVCIQFQTTP